jgi:hypothetical protein
MIGCPARASLASLLPTFDLGDEHERIWLDCWTHLSKMIDIEGFFTGGETTKGVDSRLQPCVTMEMVGTRC